MLLNLAEPQDDTVDMGLERRLAVPAEGAVREVEVKPFRQERCPEVGHLLSLRHGVQSAAFATVTAKSLISMP